MGIEYELKFRATEAELAALRGVYPGPEQIYRMETTYYDTASGDLSALGYTLRRRLENGTPVCTLKTPVSAQGRGEWEVPCQRVEDALPALCRLSGIALEPILKSAGLVPICGARFTRIAKTLTLPDCTAELALDSGVLTGGGRELPLREVELELKSGSREALDAFGRELGETFGLEVEPISKFRRALALTGREKDEII